MKGREERGLCSTEDREEESCSKRSKAVKRKEVTDGRDEVKKDEEEEHQSGRMKEDRLLRRK